VGIGRKFSVSGLRLELVLDWGVELGNAFTLGYCRYNSNLFLFSRI